MFSPVSTTTRTVFRPMAGERRDFHDDTSTSIADHRMLTHSGARFDSQEKNQGRPPGDAWRLLLRRVSIRSATIPRYRADRGLASWSIPLTITARGNALLLIPRSKAMNDVQITDNTPEMKLYRKYAHACQVYGCGHKSYDQWLEVPQKQKDTWDN